MLIRNKSDSSLDDKRNRIFSFPFSRDSRRPSKPPRVNEPQEISCRFSYVRASNSYRCYGRSPVRKASTDGSLYSSKEDLLECPSIPLRRKKLHVTRSALHQYKSGNSSSDDLLNDDSDMTDGLVSSGIPETDGSVFSSQEDVLEPKVKCSSNVSRFIRSSSSGKGSTNSMVSSSRGSTYKRLQEVQIKAELPEENGYCEKKYYFTNPSLTGYESDHYETWKKSSRDDNALRSQTPSQPSYTDVLPGGSSQVASHTVTVESLLSARGKVQNAAVKTIRTLVDHLGSLQVQIGMIEGKYNHLKDTICVLEYDQYVLDAKLTSLESQFRCSKKLSTDEPRCSQMDMHCGEEFNETSSGILRKPLSENTSVLQKSADNVQGKRDLSAKSTDTELSSSKGFSSFQQVSEETLVLLNQMKTAKSQSSYPRVTKLLGILVLTAIIWDIRSAGSFYGSKLGQTLERFGLIPYLEAFGSASKTAFIQSYKWSVVNVPVYYSRACELAGPYLLLVLEKAQGAATYCMVALESAAQYIPLIKEKIETTLPGLSESVAEYGSIALHSLQVAFITVRDASAPYLLQAHEFLTTRVFVGSLAPEKLQEYMMDAVNYISQLLLRMHSSIVDALEDTNSVPNKTS